MLCDTEEEAKGIASPEQTESAEKAMERIGEQYEDARVGFTTLACVGCCRCCFLIAVMQQALEVHLPLA